MIFSFSLIPISIGVAILRHGLYSLDIVVKKTAMALVLTLLIGVPALLVLAAASVPWLMLGGAQLRVHPPRWRPARTARDPLVRVARRTAGRIVYGSRATSYEVLTEFSERVGDAYAAEDVLPRMAQVLGWGSARRRCGGLVPDGGRAPPCRRLAGRRGGALEAPRATSSTAGNGSGRSPWRCRPPDPLRGSGERLMQDLASQAGLVLRNVRLIEELRSSRRRLVAAQDDERRKIERNLHDGAQQQLVALAVQLKLARSMVERDPAKAAALLDTLQGSATDALEDLRDLARGMLSAVARRQGARDRALEAQARKAVVPVDGRSRRGRAIPRPTSSRPSLLVPRGLAERREVRGRRDGRITLSDGSGELRFEIRDDGCGFDLVGDELRDGSAGHRGPARRPGRRAGRHLGARRRHRRRRAPPSRRGGWMSARARPDDRAGARSRSRSRSASSRSGLTIGNERRAARDHDDRVRRRRDERADGDASCRSRSSEPSSPPGGRITGSAGSSAPTGCSSRSRTSPASTPRSTAPRQARVPARRSMVRSARQTRSGSPSCS